MIKQKVRICLVGSAGGHLAHLLALREFWEPYDRSWVTFDTSDAVSHLENERTYWCYHPTNRSLKNLIRNTWLAIHVILRERPTHILSSGAAVAVPFFYLARFLGMTTIYIEVYDRIESATLTGRLVRPVTDYFLVQWPEQLTLYPDAELVGPIL